MCSVLFSPLLPLHLTPTFSPFSHHHRRSFYSQIIPGPCALPTDFPAEVFESQSTKDAMLAALGDFLGNTCSPECSALLASLRECSDDELTFQHVEEPCKSLEIEGDKFSLIKLGTCPAASDGW